MLKNYFHFTTSDVYNLYRWYKNELKKHFGNFDNQTWQTLIEFFRTKQDPNKTFHTLLDFFPQEDHPIIIAKIKNLSQDKVEILEILDQFDYGNENLLKKIFTIESVRNKQDELEIIAHSVHNDEIEVLIPFYQNATKRDVKILYNWFTKKQIPYLLMIVLVTHPQDYPRLLAWAAPWYFKLTQKILWYTGRKLQGLTIDEFLKM